MNILGKRMASCVEGSEPTGSKQPGPSPRSFSCWSRRTWWTLKSGPVVLAMTLTVMLALAGVSLRPAQADWPPITVELSVRQEGNIATAVVGVRNGGDFDADTLNVRAQVPKGAKYIDSWAGSGRGFNAGIFDGNDVGWVNPSGVKAGARQGPFVYMFDISEMSPSSRPLASAWVNWAGKAPGNAVSKAVSFQTPSPVLDVDIGAPPPAGWIWAVAEVGAGADEVVDGPQAHTFFWAFFDVKGSSELATSDGKQVLSGGEAVFVPARQEHTHRYLPQSQIIVFDVHAADDPPSAFHRGRQLFVSDTPVDVKPGLNYKVRVREFSLSPGERTPESVAAEPNFVYVIEGMLTTRAGDGVSSTNAGKASTIPLNVGHVESNEGATPLRFIVVDLHP